MQQLVLVLERFYLFSKQFYLVLQPFDLVPRSSPWPGVCTSPARAPPMFAVIGSFLHFTVDSLLHLNRTGLPQDSLQLNRIYQVASFCQLGWIS